EQPHDLLTDVGYAGEVLPSAVEPLQGGLGLLGAETAAAHLGSLELRGTGQAQPPAAEGGLQHDPRRGARGGVVGVQAPALAARTGDTTVEGEGDGVEDGG